jgi:YEATS domain-containing protein 4
LPTDPEKRPPGTAPDHTHQWTVYVRGVDGADITYWLKKVQFKLHETYSQSLRTTEAPNAFEVTETGWGEFEITIKLFFASESGEKAQSIYHQLKLHHFGDDKEAAKERGDPVISQLYEEVVFNEPAEAFYEILTSDPASASRGKGGSKSAKTKKIASRTADIPESASADGFSRRAEMEEIIKLKEAQKLVEQMIQEEKNRMTDREKELEELRKNESVAKAK